MPRRKFIKGLGILATFIAAGRFGASVLANDSGDLYNSYDSLPCDQLGPCPGINENCGNGGYKPSSFKKQNADTTKCCKCDLVNGCPPGTQPGGSWIACCVCNDDPSKGQKGKVYKYVDCCASPAGPGGKPAAGPGAPGCPYDDCFNPTAHPEYDPPQLNGWETYKQTMNCTTSSTKSWCNAHNGGPEYGTLSGQLVANSCCTVHTTNTF